MRGQVGCKIGKLDYTGETEREACKRTGHDSACIREKSETTLARIQNNWCNSISLLYVFPVERLESFFCSWIGGCVGEVGVYLYA